MNTRSRAGVRESIQPWRTTINSVPHTIGIRVYDSVRSGDISQPVLNLNGIGEGSYSASVAPTILGPNVVSPILPFQGELELTPANIERISAEVPEAIARYALNLMNEASGNHFSSIDLIARSQGGASGIRAASENPELFDRLAFIMPFGLNKEQLGDTEFKRRMAILRRLGLAGMRANPLDYGNMRSTMEVGNYMARSALKGTLFPSLDAALTFDLVDELRELAENKTVTVFVGDKDPLFPGKELRPNLEGSRAEVITLKGTHNTSGSRNGREHLTAAYEWLMVA